MLDARATGDPGLLGTADVHLRDLGLQANQPAEAFWLPLKACPTRCTFTLDPRPIDGPGLWTTHLIAFYVAPSVQWAEESQASSSFQCRAVQATCQTVTAARDDRE